MSSLVPLEVWELEVQSRYRFSSEKTSLLPGVFMQQGRPITYFTNFYRPNYFTFKFSEVEDSPAVILVYHLGFGLYRSLGLGFNGLCLAAKSLHGFAWV